MIQFASVALAGTASNYYYFLTKTLFASLSMNDINYVNVLTYSGLSCKTTKVLLCYVLGNIMVILITFWLIIDM